MPQIKKISAFYHLSSGIYNSKTITFFKTAAFSFLFLLCFLFYPGKSHSQFSTFSQFKTAISNDNYDIDLSEYSNSSHPLVFNGSIYEYGAIGNNGILRGLADSDYALLEGNSSHIDFRGWGQRKKTSFFGNIIFNDFGSMEFSGIYAYIADLIFSNSSITFSNNETRMDSGGAISSEGNSYFEFAISSVHFLNNTASEGGALYAQDNSSFVFENSEVKFTSNTASQNGGAIFSGQSKFIFAISSVHFTSNSANNGGGAIYAEQSSLFSFSNSSLNFTSNTANGNGGA
ncbi:MAG: hypothetical protein LBH29_01975, partial [Elusimicrobiota bacterium]|nr:hypothetical protein [Elusimicrobiota bacterium]